MRVRTLSLTPAPLRLLLAEGASPHRLAAGVLIGAVIGALPGFAVQEWLLVLALVLFRVSLPGALAGGVLAWGLAYAADPWLDAMGAWVLGLDALHGVFTALYNSGAARLTRFNNTVMMGNAVALLVLAVPLYAGVAVAVRRVRARRPAADGPGPAGPEGA